MDAGSPVCMHAHTLCICMDSCRHIAVLRVGYLDFDGSLVESANETGSVCLSGEFDSFFVVI